MKQIGNGDTVIIKEYENKDFLDIYHLISQELGYRDIKKNYLKQQIGQLMQSVNYTISVAILEGNVVGFIGSLETMGFIEKKYIEILILCVKEECQHQGVGAALIRHIESLAMSENISSILVNSLVHRKKAHAFYESLGYTLESVQFTKVNKCL